MTNVYDRGWRIIAVIVIIMVIVGAVACGDDEDDPAASASTPGALEGDLTVFAAASLTAAFEQVKSILEDANPDLSIAFNFAGSQQLATQLVEGADADVFASANNAQMQAARDEGVIDGEPQLLTRNRLVIIVPKDNPAAIEQPADLAKDGVKLVTAAPAVPAGQYTLDALGKMSADPQFGADFRQKVEANGVSREDNVKQVVTKVQLGEADAGIVYVTDVTTNVAPDVTMIEIPEQFNVIAEYPIAAVTGGNAELAQAFIAFVLSEHGQAILLEHGFTALP
jgi:molybdate transport system substrate-binding protein